MTAAWCNTREREPGWTMSIMIRRSPTVGPSVHGVAGPLQGHFPAIVLHRCYTEVQCHKKTTHSTLP